MRRRRPAISRKRWRPSSKSLLTAYTRIADDVLPFSDERTARVGLTNLINKISDTPGGRDHGRRRRAHWRVDGASRKLLTWLFRGAGGTGGAAGEAAAAGTAASTAASRQSSARCGDRGRDQGRRDGFARFLSRTGQFGDRRQDRQEPRRGGQQTQDRRCCSRAASARTTSTASSRICGPKAVTTRAVGDNGQAFGIAQWHSPIAGEFRQGLRT